MGMGGVAGGVAVGAVGEPSAIVMPRVSQTNV
jgi:hypothetical protein